MVLDVPTGASGGEVGGDVATARGGLDRPHGGGEDEGTEGLGCGSCWRVSSVLPNQDPIDSSGSSALSWREESRKGISSTYESF